MTVAASASSLVRRLSRLITASRDKRSTSEQAPDATLVLSDSGVEKTGSNQPNKSIGWSEVQRVLFCEPTYGYLGGTPCWIVFGDQQAIEIEEADIGERELTQWFARKLPGFDPNVVTDAYKRGYFRAVENSHLECWSRNPPSGNEA